MNQTREKWNGNGWGLALALLVWLGGTTGLRATNIWTGAGNWNTPGNWSSNHVPLDGEAVLIDGNVTLTNSTASLASYTLAAGRSQTNDGWGTVISAQVVTIYGTLTHMTNAATTTNSAGEWIPNARVSISCSSMTIATNGKIDVTGKGYGGALALTGTGPGYGPGAGGSQGGGGYGGRGGWASGGATNGLVNAPLGPGSGGGSGDRIGRPGAAGGGIVRIEAADAVTVNGSILANGLAPGAGAAGSGGGIFITCSTFFGTNGVLSASGGIGGSPGAPCGSGGGGRIAVIYDPEAQSNMPLPSVQFTTLCGSGQRLGDYGDVGTLYFPDSQFLLRQTGPVVHGGQWMAPGLEDRWARNELTLSNGWLRFQAEGYQLTVTNGITVLGTDIGLHRLQLSNAVVTCGGNIWLDKGGLLLYRGETSGPTLNCGGNMTLTNGAVLHVYSTMTPPPSDYGALVSVTGDLTIAGANSWIYPYSNPTNGGSVLFRMNRLTIAMNAGINASGYGYAGSLALTGSGPGYGPGAGAAQCGGGYGGMGGAFGANAGGKTNGLAQSPMGPGSGGGSGDRAGRPGGAGGGLVRIEAAAAVTVNGSILANGLAPGGAGGGSGGGIFIMCSTFSGSNGVLSAFGGNGGSSGAGCSGGGGGRIAVIYDPVAQSNAPFPAVQFTTLAGNALYGGNYGDVGTLYFSDSQFLTRMTDIVTHSGQWLAPGLAVWAPNNLTLSNAWLRFPAEGFELRATNALTILGTDIRLHKLEMTNAVVACGGGLVADKVTLMFNASETSGSTLDCGGNMTLTNGAVLSIYAGMTNGAAPAYGARVSVTGDLTIAANSWIYPQSHPTNGGSVLFQMANLRIAAGSAGFDATGRGYAGGAVKTNGFGPGRGKGQTYGTGGGYGGIGGSAGGGYGQAYGLFDSPNSPGSGGGGSTDGAGQTGGAGGGLIWVEAGQTVEVNGKMLANGTAGSGTYAGSGSGGGVFITCQTLAGINGQISALGDSTPYWASGGGGGRIAVLYNPVAQSNAPVPIIECTAAVRPPTGNVVLGDMGTLYFPDNQFLTRTNLILFGGRWMRPDFTRWDANSLILSNAWLNFPTDGFSMNMTHGITIVGTSPGMARLDLTNGGVACGGDLIVKQASLRLQNGAISSGGNILLDGGSVMLYSGTTAGPTLNCGGDLTLTNSSALHVYGGLTNGVAPVYGARVSVTGDIVLATTSWIYPYSHATNGGSVLFTAQNVSIATNAGFDAAGKGYRGGRAGSTTGLGPGGGLAQQGGGYGGRGGSTVETSGQTNGIAIAPAGPGSGGGGGNTSGSDGGGLVWIQAQGSVTLNGGRLLANAGTSLNVSGGGSGGGIFVECGSFSGTNGAVLNAAGADSGGWGYGGGGGRIAVWYGVPASERARILAGDMRRVAVTNVYSGFSGTISVTNGVNKNQPGCIYFPEPGTIVFLTTPKNPGTLIVIR